MCLYVEHWVARPAWLALSIPDRISFLDRIGPEMEQLTESGAELLGVALYETTLLHRSDCTYVAFWSMPEEGGQVQQLDRILEEAGWADYFERGEMAPVQPTAAGEEGRVEAAVPARLRERLRAEGSAQGADDEL